MGLEIQLDLASRWVIAEERLWLTADRSRLVPEGDAEAAFLFTLPGRRVSVEDAERYGLLKAKKAAPVEEPEAEEGIDETMLGVPLEALAEPAPETPEPDAESGLTAEPESKRSRKPKRTKG